MELQHSLASAGVEEVLRCVPGRKFDISVLVISLFLVITDFVGFDTGVLQLFVTSMHRVDQTDVFWLDPST